MMGLLGEMILWFSSRNGSGTAPREYAVAEIRSREPQDQMAEAGQ